MLREWRNCLRCGQAETVIHCDGILNEIAVAGDRPIHSLCSKFELISMVWIRLPQTCFLLIYYLLNLNLLFYYYLHANDQRTNQSKPPTLP